VEFALVLPLLLVLLLAIVQVGLLVRDQVLLVHAAREAARELAVREDPAPAPAAPAPSAAAGARASPANASAAPSAAPAGPTGPQTLADLARRAVVQAAGPTLDPARLTVEASERQGSVTVRVGYQARILAPLLQFAARDVRLTAFAEMQREIN
jgi:Flp pilus assembly protein TadG